MTESYVLYVCSQALYYIIILGAPMLVSALLVGLLISIFQATTQIQEQTLSFVPKIIATFIAAIVAGPWMAHMLARFTVELFSNIPKLTVFK